MSTEETVIKLNDELFEKLGEDTFLKYPLSFVLHTTGYSEAIFLDNWMLWNSDEDDRIYIPEVDEYEPLKDLIWNKVKELSEILNKITNG